MHMWHTSANSYSRSENECITVLLTQHLSRYDLLPFYARFIATLEPVMPDFAVEIARTLIQQLRSYAESRSVETCSKKRASRKVRIDEKIRCCRFVGELVGFFLKMRLFIVLDGQMSGKSNLSNAEDLSKNLWN